MLLSLLGFASACSDEDENQNGNLCMYGCPSVTFNVKGTVTNEAGQPIPGIQVGLKEEYTTVFTNEKGEWAFTNATAHSIPKPAVMQFTARTRKEGRIRVAYACEGFLGGYETEIRDRFYTCEAGVSVASIREDGSISGCTSIRANFHQGNIYRDDFWEVWTNRFEKFRNREWARRGKCADCNLFRYCLGNGMHLHGDDEELLVCHYERLTK